MRITLELSGRNTVPNSFTTWWEFTHKSSTPYLSSGIKLYLSPHTWQESGRPVELVIELPDTK
jgi:hypothetical protein